MKHNIKLKGQIRVFLHWSIWTSVLLLLATIGIFMIDLRCGIIMSTCLILFISISVFIFFKNRSSVLAELIAFATDYAQVQKRLLAEFEMPYGLLDDQGKILWMNQRLHDVLQKDGTRKKPIGSIFPEIKRSFFESEEEEVRTFETKYEQKIYRIVLRKISVGDAMGSHVILDYQDEPIFLTSICLFDETQLKRYIEESDNQKMTAGLIYIDNYEEALDSVESVRRSILVALIDRKINKYMGDIDGVVRKIEKDKYFVILQNKYLKHLQENKFSLLDEVRNVNIGNEMAVTLSIAFGVNGSNYVETCEYARIAMDLALGRGGNQAVLKDGENILYYGGKSKQVEKNTRVKARVKAHALREIMEDNDNVLVMGHKIGDMDCFGAAIGIYRAAKSLEKHCSIVISEITASVQPILDGFKNNAEYEDDMFISVDESLNRVDENTVVVVVDVNRPSYTECEELLQYAKDVVVLDHHRQSSEIIENAVLSYIEPYASSASEMVAEILQYIGDNIRMRPMEADALFAGIVLDTSNFVNKTGIRTFEAAAFLKRNGADIIRVRKLFRDNPEDHKAKSESVHNAEFFEESFAISVCSGESVKSPTIVAAQAANELLNINGIKASFVLASYNNKIYISARSIDEINVQIIMERLGGGGHLSVAGAQLTDCTLEEAKVKLKETIKHMLMEGDI